MGKVSWQQMLTLDTNDKIAQNVKGHKVEEEQAGKEKMGENQHNFHQYYRHHKTFYDHGDILNVFSSRIDRKWWLYN